jgi:predicted nucleotidyltransferase
VTNLSERLGEIAGRYGLANLYVFGSRSAELAARLRGEAAVPASADSDADFGAEPRRGVRLSPRDRVRLTAELEDLFQVPRVDLVVLTEAPAFLALEIVRGELLYCEDPDQQAESELYVLRRAADLAPFERERRRLILEEGGR